MNPADDEFKSPRSTVLNFNQVRMQVIWVSLYHGCIIMGCVCVCAPCSPRDQTDTLSRPATVGLWTAFCAQNISAAREVGP